MKTKLLLAVMLTTTLSAGSCEYYMNSSSKNIELAMVETGSIYKYRLRAAIKDLIKAKYECPDKYTENLDKMIDGLKERIK